MTTGSAFASEGTIDYAYDDSLSIEELEARLKLEQGLADLVSYL